MDSVHSNLEFIFYISGWVVLIACWVFFSRGR